MRYLGTVVIFSLLLYNRVNLSQASFLGDKIIADNRETMLQKFFAESKIHLEQGDPRHVTVLGVSDDQLPLVHPLLEAFPCFLGTDAARICGAEEFSPRSTIVNFLPNLNMSSLEKVFENLSLCKDGKFYLVLEGISGIVFRDVDKVLRGSMERTGRTPLLLHQDDKEDTLKIYAYAKTRNCTRRTKVLMNWTPGTKLEALDDWFASYVSFMGCPQPVATIHLPPRMLLDEHATATGEKRIEGGFEGQIIQELAKKLDITPVAPNLGSPENNRESYTKAIVQSCAAGDAILGIAGIRPTESVTSVVKSSRAYGEECVVWCVPRITRWKGSPFFSEFAWVTWVLIGLMFLASFVIERIVRNSRLLDTGNVGKPDSVRIILDIVGATLGNPIVYRPLSVGRKALLIIYICYSMVMTTAYKSSLSSMLTTGNLESSIVDVAGIIEANLTTGGDTLRLEILEDQRNELESTPELIRRYVIETNTSRALRRISNQRDFAYLTTRSNLEYHKALFWKSGERISFDVLDGCVLRYNTVVVTGSSLGMREELNRLLARLTESGILPYWKQRFFKLSASSSESGMFNSEEELRRFTRESIFLVFKCYCAALAFSILVFFAELITHKYDSARRIRRLDNLKLFKIRRRLRSL